MKRQLLLCCTTLLLACEGGLNVDLTAVPPEDVSAAVVAVRGIVLHRPDDTDTEILFDSDLEIDTVALQRGETRSLLSQREVGTGDYSGISLLLRTTSQVLDSYLEQTDGGQVPLLQVAGSSARASQSFNVQEDEEIGVTVSLDLRSALRPAPNAAGDRLIAPRLHLVESSRGATLSGNVDETLFESEACAREAPTDSGRVIYIFQGSNVIADDLDGIDPEPLTTALISAQATTADYVAAFLPAGDYTVALSCVADLDNPTVNDELGFLSSQNVSLAAGESQTLNFTATP